MGDVRDLHECKIALVLLIQIWLPNNEHVYEHEKCLFVSFVFKKFLVRLELFANIRENNIQIVIYTISAE